MAKIKGVKVQTAAELAKFLGRTVSRLANRVEKISANDPEHLK